MNLIYLFLLAPFFIYWCIKEKAGLQISITVLFCIWAVILYRHFKEKIPLDVDITWVIVVAIFCFDLFFGKKIDALLSKGGLRAYMITAAVVSFLMILYRPNYEFVLPGGIMLGISIGYCLNKRYIGFKSSDVLGRKGIKKWLSLLARFGLGVAVLAVIVLRINTIMLQIPNSPYLSQYILIHAFLCYAILGMWVFVAAPWVFLKVNLAGINANDSTGNNDK
jgi:hypothetical protein